MNINEYRAEFAAYNSAQALARYRHQVGFEPEFRIDRLRASFGDLFSLTALADLQSQIAKTWADAETESKGLHALLGAARLEYVENQAAEAVRELTACESSSRLQWNGETVSRADISFLLANEASKTRRDELAKRCAEAISTCNDLRVTRLRFLHEAASTIGFDSYWDLIAQATRVDLNQAQLAAEDLLKQTERVHRVALARIVKRASTAVRGDDLNFADLAYLDRMPWLDKFFSAQNWSKTYSETMSGLGIRVDKQANIQIASAERSGGPARSGSGCATSGNCLAACFPINPPHEVRLIFSPQTRAHDFAGSLHTAGVAQQYAWCSKTLAQSHPEFIHSPDSATAEGYGYLFSFLLLDPRWLQEFFPPISETLAVELAGDMTAVLALRVRRLAAETSYAMTLHSATQPSPEQLRSEFVDLHQRATAFHFDPELFLLRLHERIDSAAQLRALAFATGLREYLRVRYGNRWWASRKAGDELIDLWNTASRYSVEELARLIGVGEISFELLAELLVANKNGASQ